MEGLTAFLRNARLAAKPLVLRWQSLLPPDNASPGTPNSNQTVGPKAKSLLGRALLVPVKFYKLDHLSTQTVATSLGASKCTV